MAYSLFRILYFIDRSNLNPKNICERNVEFVSRHGLDAAMLRQNVQSIFHVDSKVLSAVYAAISFVTENLSYLFERLLGTRFWTEGDDITITQVDSALIAIGIIDSRSAWSRDGHRWYVGIRRAR
jgi:hypothetical protein